MLSSAVLQVNTLSGQVIRGDEEEQSNKNEKIDNCQSKASKQGKTNNHYAYNWCHGDMLCDMHTASLLGYLNVLL